MVMEKAGLDRQDTNDSADSADAKPTIRNAMMNKPQPLNRKALNPKL